MKTRISQTVARCDIAAYPARYGLRYVRPVTDFVRFAGSQTTAQTCPQTLQIAPRSTQSENVREYPSVICMRHRGVCAVWRGCIDVTARCVAGGGKIGKIGDMGRINRIRGRIKSIRRYVFKKIRAPGYPYATRRDPYATRREANPLTPMRQGDIMTSKEFLTAFAKQLYKEHWGTLEPEWFDPRFISNASEEDKQGEEYGWMVDLQTIVADILDKA